MRSAAAGLGFRWHGSAWRFWSRPRCFPLRKTTNRRPIPPQSAILRARRKLSENPAAAGDFSAQFEEWKNLLKDLRKLRLQHATASEAQKPGFEEQWDVLLAKGREMLPKSARCGAQELPSLRPMSIRN